MSLKKIKFGDKEVDKKEFYSSKQAIPLDSVVNQKCMPRPNILDVNEGVGEALFYPYNVQVNKCSGSCNTLDNHMAKLCVPNVIKGVNMQVF